MKGDGTQAMPLPELQSTETMPKVLAIEMLLLQHLHQ
jgi:hypothetical protein